MKRSNLLIILGNLTAFGPFVTDFYLPCLPELTAYFATSTSVIQSSLTAGMLGLAAGQLFIGPLTDKYGRRQPLLWCLLLFVLTTAGCMAAADVRIFLFFRLLQGFTGSCGLVVSKAILADTFTGRDLARYFALLAVVQGVAPIFAPVLGGAAFSLTSWQGAFGVLGAWGVVLWFACRALKESLRPEERLQLPVWRSFRCYGDVLRNRPYLVMNLLQSFAVAAMLAYISASPFIFQIHFGLTPMQYGVCFSCNAVGLVIGSTAVMRTGDLRRATVRSVALLLSATVLTAAALTFEWPFWIFEIALFPMLFGVGMLMPVAITRALNAVAENRGVASALVGAVPFLLGGIVAPLTGMGDMIRSTVVVMLACGGVCLLLSLIPLPRKPEI